MVEDAAPAPDRGRQPTCRAGILQEIDRRAERADTLRKVRGAMTKRSTAILCFGLAPCLTKPAPLPSLLKYAGAVAEDGCRCMGHLCLLILPNGAQALIQSGLYDMVKILANAVQWHQRRTTRSIDLAGAKELEEFRKIIKGHWHVFAQAAAWKMRSQGASANSEQIGYVVFPVSGNNVFVPFFLHDMMPLARELRKMAALGARIQVDPGSVICLSGSACQFGKIRYISDLDFCEYVPKLDHNSKDRLSELASRRDAQGPQLLSLSLGQHTTWKAPWAENLSSSDVVDKLQAAPFRQCIFVAELASLGVFEVTNLILDLDYGVPEAGSEAARSFAFQEVSISEVAWTPRDLSDPLRLGAYLAWLVENAAEHIAASGKSPRLIVKAVRRLLSACRLMMLGTEVDELIKLARNDGALLASLQDRCQLHASLFVMNRTDLNKIRKRLEFSIDKLRSELPQTEISKATREYGSLTPDEQAQFERYAVLARPIVDRVFRRVRRELQLE
ncbi:hypothetical protein QTI66_31615 [Variovorax sp. J22R133]|uniref:hypothetical protein n=1 Tax=Variovorax brevis TaxID=3053503 RepID=UPI00257603BB|nr:hypothetical protein [Variovorax sp. J22R133]MDM0116688.1 hypothetical protein [Variovorax sp. J22R133]